MRVPGLTLRMPRSASIWSSMRRNSVVLPAPLRADQRQPVARTDVEIDAITGRRAEQPAAALLQAEPFQLRIGGCAMGRAR